MISTVTLVLLLMSVLHVKVNSLCTEQVPVIGTNSERAYTPERGRRFYLNTADPAPCSGTINGWRYCFYNPSDIRDGRTYITTFAAYRATDTGYQRVSNVTVVSWSGRDINALSQSFNCFNISVSDFTIEAGDIVGGCVYDPTGGGSTRQLDIVGRNAAGYSLTRMNDESQCRQNSLPMSISSSQLDNILNSRILHVYASITVMSMPTTLPPTTTMSTTEQTTSVTWTMATTTPSETTTMDVTTTPSDSGSSTTTTTSSTTANPTAQTTAPGPASETPSEETTTTVNSITTTHTDVTTEARAATSSSASQTVGTTKVEPTTDQPMATTSDGTIDLTTTTTQNEQPTTSESDEIYSSTQAVTTLSIETTTIKDVISTIAQVSAQNRGSVDLKTIIGVVIAAVLLIVTGLVVAIIVAVIIKKRGKSIGGYLLPGKKSQSNGTANGVDNLTYDVGFHNPGGLDSSFNLYDDVANAAIMSGTGEGNYFEVTESGFSNLTYESVNVGGIYSKLSAAHTSDTQANHHHKNPSQGVSCYQLEYYSSPPEDSRESLSFLLAIERNKQEDIYGNLEAYYAPASNEDEIYSQLKSCGTNNIPHVQIRIMGHLGSGQFGNVEKGMWQRKEVALKTLKTDSTHEDKVKFLQEAAIMAQFKHPNIVTLHGVVSDKEPLMLVVELMHSGDLRDHLHSIRPDPGELPMAGLSEMLLSFSQHVALGMQYLSGKGFVHRDLAARNILVSKDNICKVADFGMSRDLADETYYMSHGGMIPVKWTAPEAIHYKKYSTASDVWSYGCLLYEIWSLGHKPFEGITNVEVVKILDSNKRLSPPSGCPRTIYELMIKCWDPITSSRPRFRELTIVLTGNPQEVLSIPQEALCAHRLAGVLGSPLKVGKNMYSDLQNKYCSENLYE